MSGHLERQELVRYVDGHPSSNRIKVAAHLAECRNCQEALQEIQAMTFLLRESRVFNDLEWRANEPERLAEPVDIAALRRQKVAESAQAETFFGELMRLPVEEWATAFESNPRERTEGMVDRLLAEVELEMKRRPRHALLLINVAESVTAALASPAMQRCAGDCWKQRANALRHLGRYEESLDAADLAASFYRLLPLGDFELGQSLYTRSVTLFKMTRYKEALTELGAATALLRPFGTTIPLAKMLMLDAAVRFEQGDIACAETTWLQAVPILETFDDRVDLARVHTNLAECSLKSGHPAKALVQAEAASAEFQKLGMDAERIRSEWTIASILYELGQHDQSLEMLYGAAADFRSLGMEADSGFVMLDITEELLRRQDWSEAARVARELAGSFANAGVTLASVMALSFLRSAVEGTRATLSLVDYVRDYVTHDDPSRVFTPPS